MLLKLQLINPDLVESADIVFSTAYGYKRFITACLLLACSFLCLFTVAPSSTGKILSLVIFLAFMMEVICKCFATEVIIQCSVKQVQINKWFLKWRFLCRHHHYTDVLLSMQSFYRFHGTVGVTPLLYVITIDTVNYILLFPAKYYPASEDKLNDIRMKLAFDIRN